MSAGERLVGRSLETERLAGVPHYVAGQMRASVVGPDDVADALGEDGKEDFALAAEVSYVDSMGHACVLLCVKEPDGEWEPFMMGRAGVQLFEGWKSAEGFELSERMREALAVAEKEAVVKEERG